MCVVVVYFELDHHSIAIFPMAKLSAGNSQDLLTHARLLFEHINHTAPYGWFMTLLLLEN